MSLDRRAADPKTQESVDDMILDYLSFAATKALLEEYANVLCFEDQTAPQPATIRILKLASSFSQVHASLHSTRPLGPKLAFRNRLLTFAQLFTGRRLHASCTNNASKTPEDDSSAHKHCPHNLRPVHHFAQKHRPNVQASPSQSCQSLMQTLPKFMALSAAQCELKVSNEEEVEISERWMTLAAEYMMQAVLEQIMVFGSSEPLALHNTFHWGLGKIIGADVGTDEFRVKEMFLKIDCQSTGALWLGIRDDYRDALEPPHGVGMQDHARQRSVEDFPIANFENRVLTFLESLHHDLPPPLLEQIGSASNNPRHASIKVRWE